MYSFCRIFFYNDKICNAKFLKISEFCLNKKIYIRQPLACVCASYKWLIPWYITRWASHCFPIETTGKHDIRHMIARHSIKTLNRKIMWGTRYLNPLFPVPSDDVWRDVCDVMLLPAHQHWNRGIYCPKCAYFSSRRYFTPTSSRPALSPFTKKSITDQTSDFICLRPLTEEHFTLLTRSRSSNKGRERKIYIPVGMSSSSSSSSSITWISSSWKAMYLYRVLPNTFPMWQFLLIRRLATNSLLPAFFR